jgi:hypothetical protein
VANNGKKFINYFNDSHTGNNPLVLDETETVLNYFNFLKNAPLDSEKMLLLIPHQSMYNIFFTYLYSLSNKAHGFGFCMHNNGIIN